MCRTMRRRVFVLALLSIGLVVSIPGSVLARGTITVVEGRANLLDDVEGEDPRPDSAGNLHFHHVLAQGDFSLQGDGIAIDGTQTLVLNGSVDRSFSGPFAGTFTRKVKILELTLSPGVMYPPSSASCLAFHRVLTHTHQV